MAGADGVMSGAMETYSAEQIQAELDDYGFAGWGVRLEGRRLRCPHGLLIGLTEECPVGCISPLVVLGLTDPLPYPALNA